MKVNYAEPFLRTVRLTLREGGLTLALRQTEVRFDGEVFSCTGSARTEKRISAENGVLKVRLQAVKSGKIEDYRYFDGVWSGADEIVIASTNLSGICAFLRAGEVSFFLSLDFPYSRIEGEGRSVSIGCDPSDFIREGEVYLPHTLTAGAVVLTGEKVGKYDVAEIEGFSEYVRRGMPEKFNGSRPIFSSASITNRMCDVREGRIFYSMYDNPTLTLDPGTLKDEVRLLAELGVEYYQVFEGFFDWEEDGSSERNLKEIVALGKELGVRVGDYVTALELNCWHFNYHDRRVTDPGMLALSGNGDRYYLCYGSDKTVKMLEDTVLQSIKRNGEEMICLDGNCYVPCEDESHGHAKNSVYRLIRGLVRFMEKLNAVSPYFMTWTNAGNWIEFMPKLLWYNPNVYLTDPHPREYASSLNNLKYYGDCRREQMVSVHNKYFVPYVAFTNCEYYAFRHSRVDDEAFFEYSFLQGLCVTPNVCLGEIRTFLERSSAKRNPYIKAFIKKWLAFLRGNIDSWRYVYRVGDVPGADAYECYAHVDGEKGFLCFVNQDYYTKTFSVALDGSVGLRERTGERFLLTEIYPRECPLAEQPLPGPLYGEKISLSVPGFSVRIIRIGKYLPPENGVRVYGVGCADAGADRFAIEEENGSEIPVAVWSEDGSVNGVSVQTAPNVPKYFFPSHAENFVTEGRASAFVLHMPRERAVAELSEWTVGGEKTPCRLADTDSDFRGGYVHNVYREKSRVFLSLSRGKPSAEEISAEGQVGRSFFNSVGRTGTSRTVGRSEEYVTQIRLPFIEYLSLANVYGFDEVLEFVFRDASAVGGIRAYIDGREVPVLVYRNPASPQMKTYYLELSGEIRSGVPSELRVKIDWLGTVGKESKKEEPSSSAGAKVVGQT